MFQSKLDWGAIKRVTTDLETVLNQQIEVFNDELATLRGVKVKVYIKQGSNPKFFKPRLTSHALKQGIEKGLDRLENMGVMEHVTGGHVTPNEQPQLFLLLRREASLVFAFAEIIRLRSIPR